MTWKNKTGDQNVNGRVVGVLRGRGVARRRVHFPHAYRRAARNSGAGRPVEVRTVSDELRALRAWIAKRGDDAGALFCAVNKADRASGQAITDKAVALILARVAKRASVADVSPHDMRRTMISDLLDAGGDIATVQRLAGHAQVTTTQRYDRRGERAKLRTAGLLPVPYDG